MGKTEILNAKIAATKLGEAHGCLTADLMIEGEGWSCAFGGYCLDHWFLDIGEHSSPDGYGVIIELMKALEVNSWEELNGMYVRVEIEGWGGKILRIGHLMKDRWFSFKEYFENVNAKNTGPNDSGERNV